ncbi:MAG: CPBP family intramembrane metalloprotease [Nitrospirae bacterium]|nr:CPBP family intramembrane metalloprotease [Nitrospirota bacterium]
MVVMGNNGNEMSNYKKIIQLVLVGLSVVAWQAIFVVILAVVGQYTMLPGYVYVLFSLAALLLPLTWCHIKFGKVDNLGSVKDAVKWSPIFVVFAFLVIWSRHSFVAPHFSLAYVTTSIVILEIILGPVIEETLFRGYILKMLTEEVGIYKAILLTAFLSVLVHVVTLKNLPFLVSVFVCSVIFSSSYAKGKLYTAIIVHIFVNFLVTIWV